MTYREADHEAVTVQKLRAMEDLLKSFMASLEEPLQKGWEEFDEVISPVEGRILKWTKGDNTEVWPSDPLCEIEYTEFGEYRKHIWLVSSPAKGTLHIIVREGSVSEGMKIGVILRD